MLSLIAKLSCHVIQHRRKHAWEVKAEFATINGFVQASPFQLIVMNQSGQQGMVDHKT